MQSYNLSHASAQMDDESLLSVCSLVVLGREPAKGAVNTPADVSTVQRLLQTAAEKLDDSSLDPKGIDGKIARVAAKSNTVAAIQAFQTRSALQVTGLIDPADKTWVKLLGGCW